MGLLAGPFRGLSGSSWPAWGRVSPGSAPEARSWGHLMWVDASGDCPHPPRPPPPRNRHSGWRTGTPSLVTVTPCHHASWSPLAVEGVGLVLGTAPPPFTPGCSISPSTGHGTSPAMGSGRHPPSSRQVLQPAGEGKEAPRIRGSLARPACAPGVCRHPGGGLSCWSELGLSIGPGTGTGKAFLTQGLLGTRMRLFLRGTPARLEAAGTLGGCAQLPARASLRPCSRGCPVQGLCSPRLVPHLHALTSRPV